MRAAIYVRQSLDVQEGVERQLKRCSSLITARGWTEAARYADNDTSATKARGPGTGWARMLADAETDTFDVVVAVDMDRLLRSVNDLVTLTASGVRVLTVDGEIDLTTADGEFRATMLAAIAQFETRRKGERQRRANAYRASQGRPAGGRRPFGFEADGMTVREDEAEAVRAGYRSILAGDSLRQVARDWNAQGFHTGQPRQARTGRAGEPSPWIGSTVGAVLRNPRYKGEATYKGEVVGAALWPALVDAETWEAANLVLADPNRRTPRQNTRHLLSGLALCGICGSTVHGGASRRRGQRAYRCSASSGHISRKAEPIEQFVVATMVERLSRPDAAALLRPDDTSDLDALRSEAAGLRSRLDSLAVDFADGALTSSQLRTATGRIRSRLEEVERPLAAAIGGDMLSDLLGADDVAAAWEALSQDRQRAVIAALATVRIKSAGQGARRFDPATVGIEWTRAG